MLARNSGCREPAAQALTAVGTGGDCGSGGSVCPMPDEVRRGVVSRTASPSAVARSCRSRRARGRADPVIGGRIDYRSLRPGWVLRTGSRCVAPPQDSSLPLLSVSAGVRARPLARSGRNRPTRVAASRRRSWHPPDSPSGRFTVPLCFGFLQRGTREACRPSSMRKVHQLMTGPLYDVIGIGFGPANIALAAAFEERGEHGAVLFLEQGHSVLITGFQERAADRS